MKTKRTRIDYAIIVEACLNGVQESHYCCGLGELGGFEVTEETHTRAEAITALENEGFPLILATTIPEQTEAIRALKGCGFRAIGSGQGKTKNIITLWLWKQKP